MTPLAGWLTVLLTIPIVALLMVTVPAELKVSEVFPMKRKPGVATLASAPFFGGGTMFCALILRPPLENEGLLPHPLSRQPGEVGDCVSIMSVALEPKLGVPQISSESLEWNGPWTASPVTNWMSAQPTVTE